MAIIKYLFEIEKHPRKGLLPAEWAGMVYLVLTLLLILFTSTKLPGYEALIWGRLHVFFITMALWGVYRLIPNRFMHLCRVIIQIALLSWWYPDTYELNRLFPNLDHVFASYEQQLFGCQPALLFSQLINNPVWSELIHMGYASYYPLIVVVTVFYFFYRYEEFDRTAFIIIAAFFIHYAIFVFLPVTGPQFYYHAVGLDNIARGIFPDVGNYFVTHTESLPIPGWSGGLFYNCVASAHALGERPTAAFPSSHIGITTILLFLAWRSRNRRLLLFCLPFYALMCLATVYIQAHYAIDVIAGWISATVCYVVLSLWWKVGLSH